MSELDKFFKFRIGEVVTHVTALPLPDVPPAPPPEEIEARRQWRRTYGCYPGVAVEPSLVVLGRLLEECYGGVQAHYVCRVDSVTEKDHKVQYSEIELRRKTPPDPATTPEARWGSP